MIDSTGPALSMPSADPAMATNGTVVTISVSTESGATVTADASAIGGAAAVPLDEGMDATMMATGMYSVDGHGYRSHGRRSDGFDFRNRRARKCE